jgi:hypothetical protein
LLSKINQQNLVSGADAKELVKILRGMGPRPSVEELSDMYHKTPGTSHARVGRIAAHVLQGLATHLGTMGMPNNANPWLEEIISWQKAYLEDTQPDYIENYGKGR